MLKLFKSHKSIILYVLFGGITTLINILVYMISYQILGISNVLSNIFAWILSVLFAFISNKLWVFGSKSINRSIVLNEFFKFVGGRLATGLLDLLIMYICVDLLAGPALLFKIISNMVVIILNYIISKMLVFKKKNIRHNGNEEE